MFMSHICPYLFVGDLFSSPLKHMNCFISLLWYYDTDILWYQQLGSTWRDMNEGNIQYDKRMTPSGAIM